MAPVKIAKTNKRQKLTARKNASNSLKPIEEDPKSASSSSDSESSDDSSSSSASTESASPPLRNLRTTQKSAKSPSPSKAKSRAPGAKEKGKSILKPSPSDKVATFISVETERHFRKNIMHRSIICESTVSLADFSEVAALIEKRKWMKTVTDFVVPVQSLVQEFFANFSESFGKPGPHKHQVFVRGVWIDFNVDIIRNVLHLPVPDVVFDWLSADLNTVAEVLSGGSISEWPKCGYLPPSALTLFYRILFRISLSNWYPSLHNSTVRPDRAQLIYSIGTGKGVDLGSILFSCIKDAAESSSTIQTLPLPSLVHRLCLKGKIKLLVVEPCLKLKVISSTSFKHHVSAASSRPKPESTQSETSPWKQKFADDLQALNKKSDDLCKQLSAQMTAMETTILDRLGSLERLVQIIRAASSAPPHASAEKPNSPPASSPASPVKSPADQEIPTDEVPAPAAAAASGGPTVHLSSSSEESSSSSASLLRLTAPPPDPPRPKVKSVASGRKKYLPPSRRSARLR